MIFNPEFSDDAQKDGKYKNSLGYMNDYVPCKLSFIVLQISSSSSSSSEWEDFQLDVI